MLDGIYEVYFAGHGDDRRGGFIAEPNNPDSNAVDGSSVCPPYKLHAVFALACYSGKNPAWRIHVSPKGVFVGFEGLSGYWNEEHYVYQRWRFWKGHR